MLENCVFPVHNPPVSLHVLIAPDKFKGTLTALEAAKAIARGWSDVRPEDELTQLPISDGGDGFGPLIANPLNAFANALNKGFRPNTSIGGPIPF